MATYILTAKTTIHIGNQKIDRNSSVTIFVPDSISKSFLFTHPQSKSIIGERIATQSGLGIPPSKIPVRSSDWDVKVL